MKANKKKVNHKVISEEVTKEKEEIVSKMEEENKPIEEPKKKYLVCYFCENKQYDINSVDPTGAWCYVCGRCFPPIWEEE